MQNNYIDYSDYSDIKPFIEFKEPSYNPVFFFIRLIWTSHNVNGGIIWASIIYVVVLLLALIIGFVLDLIILCLFGLWIVVKYLFSLLDLFLKQLLNQIVKSVLRPILFIGTLILIFMLIYLAFKYNVFSQIIILIENLVK